MKTRIDAKLSFEKEICKIFEKGVNAKYEGVENLYVSLEYAVAFDLLKNMEVCIGLYGYSILTGNHANKPLVKFKYLVHEDSLVRAEGQATKEEFHRLLEIFETNKSEFIEKCVPSEHMKMYKENNFASIRYVEVWEVAQMFNLSQEIVIKYIRDGKLPKPAKDYGENSEWHFYQLAELYRNKSGIIEEFTCRCGHIESYDILEMAQREHYKREVKCSDCGEVTKLENL